MNVMENLLAQIRKSVERGDVTMSGLATRVGCTRQHLYGVINGNHNLSLELAEKLASAVGFEIVCKKKREKLSA